MAPTTAIEPAAGPWVQGEDAAMDEQTLVYWLNSLPVPSALLVSSIQDLDGLAREVADSNCQLLFASEPGSRPSVTITGLRVVLDAMLNSWKDNFVYRNTDVEEANLVAIELQHWADGKNCIWGCGLRCVGPR